MTTLQKLYWFFYRLTPQGKKAWLFKRGFDGFIASAQEKRETKKKVYSSAAKKMKPKKILAFHKGQSVSKSKKSTHQVIKSVENEHGQELQERGLRITKKGTFKNA